MTRLGNAIFWMALTAGSTAFAGGKDFVIARSGAGGSTETAAAYIETFLRFAEGKLGWPASGAKGKFFGDKEGALKYIAEQKPGFGLLDPYLWLELRKTEALEVIATVHGDNVLLGHYSVVVKDPAIKTLDDLKGKLLLANHLQSPKFLSKVGFDGKLDVETHFKLQSTASPLKGLKAVDRGEAAATIVDDRQLAQMKTLPFGKELRVIYTSPQLPPMPLVAFGKASSAEDRAKLGKMLTTMCADSKGAEVCKSLEVTKFSAPEKAAYDDAIRRFDRK